MGAKRSKEVADAVAKLIAEQRAGRRYTTLDAAQEFGLVFQTIMVDAEYRAFRGLPPKKKGKPSP